MRNVRRSSQPQLFGVTFRLKVNPFKNSHLGIPDHVTSFLKYDDQVSQQWRGRATYGGECERLSVTYKNACAAGTICQG